MKYLISAVLSLLALALAGGGAYLALLGGSAAYLMIGLVIGSSAVLCFMDRSEARWAYALLLVGTLLWALWESGLDGWALAPRLILIGLVGLLLLIPALRKGPARRSRMALASASLMAIGLPAALLAVQFERVQSPSIAAGTQSEVSETVDWADYGANVQGTRHSELAQLTPANVSGLKEVWRYSLNEVNTVGKGGLQVTPLQVRDTLYLCSSFNDIVALDAESGKERWRHGSKADREGVLSAGCRGVGYYRSAAGDAHCAERIITNTIDARLIAVDLKDGKSCESFGRNGEVDLLTGMGRKYKGYYYQTSAPLIFEDKIIVGGWVTDNQYWGEPSGAIRAFDANTGAFAWALDLGNQTKQREPATGETYTLSSPNAWAPMSADPETGLIFAPLGNPTPDYFGGHRRPVDEKFGSSVIAIEAATGKLRWSFQTTHHDLWDYDVASQPTVADIPTAHGLRQAIIQPTKRGEIFVLDRLTGKPLRDVKEMPVPQGGIVPGERLSPTQPFSTGMPSLRGADLSERRMWGITPLDQIWCRIRFRQARYEGPLTPPGLKPSITWPGYLGGMNWGSASWDRETGKLVMNANHVPNYTRLVPRREANDAGVKAAQPGVEGNFAFLAQEGLPYAAQTGPFLSPLGIPCTQPPFGELMAVDVESGRLAWKKRLGTAEESGFGPFVLGLPLLMGTPTGGGAITTSGGLTFIGATPDRNLRAYENRTGRLLWKSKLPAGAQATPMTYFSKRSNRQFVVVAAGGNVWLRSKLGDDIVAFALPTKD